MKRTIIKSKTLNTGERAELVEYTRDDASLITAAIELIDEAGHVAEQFIYDKTSTAMSIFHRMN